MKRNKAVGMCAVIVAATCVASAEPVILVAKDVPALENSFTVNFPPELGGPQTAEILSTSLAIEVDPVAGTASLKKYSQQVAPLLLGPFSTGNITVEIAGPSVGTTDLTNTDQFAAGEFDTTEAFNVYFEGDLSAFGLVSPFYTESGSNGSVSFRTDSTGLITMGWAGAGTIPNPFDPQNPFPFEFSCKINTKFDQAVSCAAVTDLKARCKGGLLSVLVNMVDGSFDGQKVAVDVDGVLHAATIKGNKASILVGADDAPSVSLVTDAGGCVATQTPVCE